MNDVHRCFLIIAFLFLFGACFFFFLSSFFLFFGDSYQYFTIPSILINTTTISFSNHRFFLVIPGAYSQGGFLMYRQHIVGVCGFLIDSMIEIQLEENICSSNNYIYLAIILLCRLTLSTTQSVSRHHSN